MPNGHEYPAAPHNTSNCKHGCGCWAGPSRSGGPLGLEPIGGRCPNNLLDGEDLRPTVDYEQVVNDRIDLLRDRAISAEQAFNEVKPSKKKLAEDLKNAREILAHRDSQIADIQAIVSQ